MKKTILFVVAAFTLSAGVFAATGETPDHALLSFEKHFAGAKDVTWENDAAGFRKATFVWGGHRTIAYYTTEGELAGTARGLFFAQVPMSVSRAFYRNFEKAIVLDVKEITNSEGTRYLILMEQKNKKYRTTINNYGEVVKTEKLKK
ncbi:MAG TPA: hypothetical protein PKC69_05015 [Chitinophagaceae bacterium]|nr:hypothetical protein [Chitinophagaceae bacterium]